MQGMILAAGMGSRLGSLTAENTKCMVKVNGVSLIERMLKQLDSLNLNKIVIVVGYQGQKLIDFISTLSIKTPVVYVENSVYDKTNNIYSLYLARNHLLEDDTLLLESDIIFEDKVLSSLCEDTRETLAVVDKYESWMDGTVVRINDDDTIFDVISGSEFNFHDVAPYYKTVNIYKFSRSFSEHYYLPFLEAYIHAMGNNQYYETVLKVLIMLNTPCIQAKRLEGEKWYEIDDIQDLDIASTLFADEKKQVELFQNAYGGYWRFPKLLDFCYLVNPYYPSKKLIDEMQASFIPCLTQYPSGMARNSLLAAKNFNVEKRHIVVGNGAAELIKSLMEIFSETQLGFIRPTFEEYPNRCKKENCVAMYATAPDFSYTADDVMNFFSKNTVDSLVLINPDNPSGNYISQKDIFRLASWAESHGISLVIDESFADFADEENNTLIDEKILQQFPHLIVVKSISKSHGVPGIRLGVLASYDEELIIEIKKDVSIWNISSFGEFYMQIAGKYRRDYKTAISKYRNERTRFIEKLREIACLRVIPTQANFIMCEVTGKTTSAELTQKLLSKDIFIKDLTEKIRDGRQYVRLAIRNTADNDRLVSVLREIL